MKIWTKDATLHHCYGVMDKLIPITQIYSGDPRVNNRLRKSDIFSLQELHPKRLRDGIRIINGDCRHLLVFMNSRRCLQKASTNSEENNTIDERFVFGGDRERNWQLHYVDQTKKSTLQEG